MSKATLTLLFRIAMCAGTVLLLSLTIRAQQMADPDFKATVERPAFTRKHPAVVIDEAHSNFHTAEGRYKPFAELLRSDGYKVVLGTKKFEKGSLDGASVLVISNAAAPDATADTSRSAFTDQECDVVRDWVRAGGALLLIADHTPFGSAAENLAKRFGVGMGKGYVFDLKNSETGNPSVLVFSRENKLLGTHTLLRGRNSSEEVKRIVTFTGQSLIVPDGATVLLRLDESAREAPNREEMQAALAATAATSLAQKNGAGTAHASPVGGRAQGLAMKFGKGRVVILAEAAMFSAQVIRYKEGDEQREFKMGMNVPGNDDRQFALNVLHWLSGLLK